MGLTTHYCNHVQIRLILFTDVHSACMTEDRAALTAARGKVYKSALNQHALNSVMSTSRHNAKNSSQVSQKKA